MTTIAIVLILISALLHVTWNMMGKGSVPSPSFFLVANLSSVIIMLPIAFLTADVLPYIPVKVWLLLLATALCQAVYFVGLGRAYMSGDISFSYPLARALPVVFVPLVTIMLGFGSKLSIGGIAGMGVVTAGCLIMPIRDFRKIGYREFFSICALFALIAALGTTGYTVIDSEALKILGSEIPDRFGAAYRPLFFIFYETLFTSVVLAVAVMARRNDRIRLKELSGNGALKHAIAAGLLCTVAYILILVAMGHVSNVSYVSAFRQLSIPLGTAAGIVIFKEDSYPAKIISVCLIVTGLAMVKFL